MLALSTLLLAGCTTPVPLQIRHGPQDNPTPALAAARLADYVGQTVRWGGVLIATDNLATVTRLSVLARPLAADGEPQPGDDSQGRFIAVVPAFLDPAQYVHDRRVTVSGILRAGEIGMVGTYPYVYPVVEAQAWYLWPDAVAPYGSPYPWWYDPWYGPWWFGSGYDPWYFPDAHPHWHPRYHPHPQVPARPDMAPGTGARPPMPAPRTPQPAAHGRPAPRPEPAHAQDPANAHPGRQAHGAMPAPVPLPPAEPAQREHAPAHSGQRHAPPTASGHEPPAASAGDAAAGAGQPRAEQRHEPDRAREPAQRQPAPDAAEQNRGLRGFFRRWRNSE
ncbi:MAG: Slp family lipoprotein [Pseudomonadota bacterium]